MKKTIHIKRLNMTLDYNDACSLSAYHDRTGMIDEFTEKEFDYIMSRFKIDQTEELTEYHLDQI